MSLEQAPIATPVDHEELRIALASAWRVHRDDVPTDGAVALLMSQSALETARWSRCFNFNLSGIKSPGVDVPHVYLTTLERMQRAVAAAFVAKSTSSAPCEIVEDKGESTVVVRFHPRNPVCRFRAFASLGQACAGKLALLSTRYRRALEAAQASDLPAFVHELRAGGYFTAKESEYAAGVDRYFVEFAVPCLSTEAEIATVLGSLGYDDVRAFQESAGLVVDGIVGPATRRAIRRHLAGGGS